MENKTQQNVVSIKKIFNNLVIKKEVGDGLFISSKNSIIISIPSLCALLKFMLLNKYISPKVLEGLLEEYNSFSGDIDNYVNR